MHIPDTSFCPDNIKHEFVKRFDVKSTADSFKSWDTCMDNKTCKIVAIVLIVLGGLIVMWAVSTIIRCACLGFSCLEALCCCCCRSGSKEYHEKQMNHPYNNPNMYGNHMPPPPVAYRGNPGYQPGYDSGYDSRFGPVPGPIPGPGAAARPPLSYDSYDYHAKGHSPAPSTSYVPATPPSYNNTRTNRGYQPVDDDDDDDDDVFADNKHYRGPNF